MKNIILTAFLTVCAISQAAAQSGNPYEQFGYEGRVLKTKHEQSGIHTIEVVNSDTTQVIRKLVFDWKKREVGYVDRNGGIISKDIVPEELALRFLSTDPKERDYPGLSPYSYVGNMPIRAIDPDGKDIFILFTVSGNHHGDEAFAASASTRKRNIESSNSFDPAKDKVVVLQITNMGQIKDMVAQTVKDLSKQYGPTAEVGIWSHAAMDGPIGSEASTNDPVGYNQMGLQGWGEIDFNWAENNASMAFYGCNTGRDVVGGEWRGSFARQISDLDNFNNVDVAGQSTSAFPSFYPDVRVTNFARSANTATSGILPDYGFGVGSTYMVGGNKGEGGKAMWFNPFDEAPAANPMNVYRDFNKVRSGTQSTSADRPVN